MGSVPRMAWHCMRIGELQMEMYPALNTETSVRMIEPAGFAKNFEIATLLLLSTDIT